jgi:hypothetical protein
MGAVRAVRTRAAESGADCATRSQFGADSTPTVLLGCLLATPCGRSQQAVERLDRGCRNSGEGVVGRLATSADAQDEVRNAPLTVTKQDRLVDDGHDGAHPRDGFPRRPLPVQIGFERDLGDAATRLL